MKNINHNDIILPKKKKFPTANNNKLKQDKSI